MNLKLIKDIVLQDGLPTDLKERMIISVLAEDEKVIPSILNILSEERKVNKELVTDLNVELSRALLIIEDPTLEEKKGFVLGEIKKFYKKWEDKIRCNFKVKGLK